MFENIKEKLKDLNTPSEFSKLDHPIWSWEIGDLFVDVSCGSVSQLSMEIYETKYVLVSVDYPKCLAKAYSKNLDYWKETSYVDTKDLLELRNITLQERLLIGRSEEILAQPENLKWIYGEKTLLERDDIKLSKYFENIVKEWRYNDHFTARNKHSGGYDKNSLNLIGVKGETCLLISHHGATEPKTKEDFAKLTGKFLYKKSSHETLLKHAFILPLPILVKNYNNWSLDNRKFKEESEKAKGEVQLTSDDFTFKDVWNEFKKLKRFKTEEF